MAHTLFLGKARLSITKSSLDSVYVALIEMMLIDRLVTGVFIPLCANGPL